MNSEKRQEKVLAESQLDCRQSLTSLIRISKTRSFVTCDDPKGVVECGTIRKSKSVSQKMEDNKIKSHRTQKNSNTSLAYKGNKEEMVPVEDFHSPSSFQLLEVSRGAQKLNHLIDSWSKGLSYDGQSKDIAKDLLKGALDLQESLTMLGKLQEASQYMAQLKKKQKERLERKRSTNEVGSAIMNLHRLGDHNQQLGFQNPRLSADGSSRDCIEELRNAIRYGFARQNLLPHASRQEKIKFDKRKMDSISQIPSTSSSQLSVVQSQSSHSTASSSSHTVIPKKEKNSNLIAKLMGLEDIPPKAVMQSPQKQLVMEKNSSPQRPVFEIERPKLRKPQSIVHKVDSERRTLKEILETVQFQGLLKGTSAKELKSQSHQSSNFHYKQRFVDDVPPIVLIKPMHISRSDSEEAHSPMVWEDGALSRKMMLRKMKIKGGLALRAIDDKRVTSNSRKMNCRTEAEKPPFERVIQEQGAKDHIKEVVIPEEKEVRTINQKEEAVMVNRVNRKLKAEKASVKRHFHEEGRKDCKEVVIRTEEKQVKKKLKDPSTMKVSNPATHQQQEKDITDKQVDKVQNVEASSKKPVEKEILKNKNGSRSPDQAKLTSTRLRKPDNGSIPTNDHISKQHTSTRKTISKQTTQNTIHNSKDRKLKEKETTECASAKPITDNLECKEYEKRIDLSCSNHSQKKESTTIVIDQQPMEEETDASEFQTEEHCDDSQTSLCMVTLPASECGKTSKFCKETDNQMTQITTDSTNFKTGNQLKDLLLSSPSFLNLAEDAFHLNMSYPKITPTYGIYDCDDIDIKLSLDYANEYTERRSLPDSKTRHHLSSYTGNSRFHISLDQLVEEVCSGVETLKSFHKVACDELRGDSLYATLERDMMCKGVVNGIWDLGWRSGCTSEEVEQTVNDLEKLLVSELIGEVFS